MKFAVVWKRGHLVTVACSGRGCRRRTSSSGLQHGWLSETPCGDSLYREDEVDDDKKTDIQLGTGRGFTVCIEIKPLDDGRYSAAELVSTLKDQIVGQYLKGQNSANGILVLFQLKDRKWKVPGYHGLQSFDALLAYLNIEAERIRREHNAQKGVRPVEALVIFGIRCYVK